MLEEVSRGRDFFITVYGPNVGKRCFALFGKCFTTLTFCPILKLSGAIFPVDFILC